MGPIEAIAEDRKNHTPGDGANLCSIDGFEPLGEQLSTVAHFDTVAEAEHVMSTLPGDHVIIEAEEE